MVERITSILRYDKVVSSILTVGIRGVDLNFLFRYFYNWARVMQFLTDFLVYWLVMWGVTPSHELELEKHEIPSNNLKSIHLDGLKYF